MNAPQRLGISIQSVFIWGLIPIRRPIRAPSSGPKQETTAAAAGPGLLARPLDARWLARLARSSAPFPPDAPGDALDRVRAHPQFRAP